MNISEGRRAAVLRDLVGAAGSCLLDLHHDPHHHRAVLTLGAADGAQVEAAVRAVARAAAESVDLRDHRGVHPRFGVIDVVPFVALGPGGRPAGPQDDLAPALAARARFAQWAAGELGIPCFYYGPERSLPHVRRQAFTGALPPDTGPEQPHPTAGACAVGARPALVAWNLWLQGATIALVRTMAAAVRSPAVRALGLQVGTTCQVSCNLVDPYRVGPLPVHQAVTALAAAGGARVVRAELVGLAPAAVVEAVEPALHELLDLSPERTVEARLASLA